MTARERRADLIPRTGDLEASNEIVHALREMASEPLFELSMSSRELFHSNFLSWLVRTHQKAGRSLVGDLLGDPGPEHEILRVDREKHDVDLHLYSTSGDDIWVEMKIGAIPAAAQLLRYADKLSTSQRPQRFVLVSLQPLTRLPAPWVSVDLSELAGAMRTAAQQVQDGFARDLVLHEALLLNQLSSLGSHVDAAAHLDASWFMPAEVQTVIREVRAGTIVEKLRSGLVLNHLTVAYSDPKLEFAAGLTNGTGVVEVRKALCDGRTVGWQLQGPQYRLFAESERPSKRGASQPPLGVESEDLGSISPWFDFSNALTSMPGLSLSSRASGHGKFGTIFRYQYLQIPAAATNREVLRLLDAETQRLEDLGV